MGCEHSINKSTQSERVTTIDEEFEMYAAIVKGNTKKVSNLISQGFDVNYKMTRFIGRSCLHIAAEAGQSACFQLLLDSGADVNQKDRGGLVPIYIAASQADLQIVEMCLKKGANCKVVTGSSLEFKDFIPKSHERPFRALLNRYRLFKVLQ